MKIYKIFKPNNRENTLVLVDKTIFVYPYIQQCLFPFISLSLSLFMYSLISLIYTHFLKQKSTYSSLVSRNKYFPFCVRSTS